MSYIDIDGIECLKNIHKLNKFYRFGFAKMSSNAVFDSSDFVKNQANFYDGVAEATGKTIELGPNPV